MPTAGCDRWRVVGYQSGAARLPTSPCTRRFLSRVQIRRHPVKQLLEAGELSGAEAAAQAAVERDGGLAQSLKRRLACIGQRDHMNPAVAPVTAAREEPVGLHRVEMVRQRGLANPDRLG